MNNLSDPHTDGQDEGGMDKMKEEMDKMKREIIEAIVANR